MTDSFNRHVSYDRGYFLSRQFQPQQDQSSTNPSTNPNRWTLLGAERIPESFEAILLLRGVSGRVGRVGCWWFMRNIAELGADGIDVLCQLVRSASASDIHMDISQDELLFPSSTLQPDFLEALDCAPRIISSDVQ